MHIPCCLIPGQVSSLYGHTASIALFPGCTASSPGCMAPFPGCMAPFPGCTAPFPGCMLVAWPNSQASPIPRLAPFPGLVLSCIALGRGPGHTRDICWVNICPLQITMQSLKIIFYVSPFLLYCKH